MTGKTLVAFFAITFALAWGLLVAFIAIPQIEGLFGPLGYTNPLYFLMVWAPAFAGVGLVARHHGIRGVGGLLRRQSSLPAVHQHHQPDQQAWHHVPELRLQRAAVVI